MMIALALAGLMCSLVLGQSGDVVPEHSEKAQGLLDGTRWRLTAWAARSSAPAQYKITAFFNNGEMTGNAPVNTYGASYTATADGRFSVGEIYATLRGGSESAMRAERIYFNLLGQAQQFTLTENTLTLQNAAGQPLLIFRARGNSTTTPRRVLEFTGTVVWVPLEGGFFAIEDDSGQTYDPINLPREFQQSGLRVRGTALLRMDMASIHMYGKLIEILTISRF